MKNMHMMLMFMLVLLVVLLQAVMIHMTSFVVTSSLTVIR
jgi:hypothetical protein